MELVRHADLSGYTHPFGILSDEDAWTLLEQTAFPEENETVVEVKAKMEELGKEMLKHCKGLPLAIVALGGILATKGKIHEWETASRNISSYMSDEVRGGGGDKVLSVLELSYDDLPFYLKPCFMYLGVFPEDYEIPADRLYHLWEAEGLVTISDEEKADFHGVAMDDIAETYLNQLVNRSMVQVDKRWPDGSIKSCRLHDIMRDMCLNKCRQVNFLQITDALSDSDTVCASSMNRKSRRHAICAKNDLGVRSFMNTVDENEASYKRSLIVYYEGWYLPLSMEELLYLNMGKFFSLLRVLDLGEGLDMEGAGVLKYCIHLRYLSLRVNLLGGVIDDIWDCKYLETLDLRVDWGPGVVELSNELWKLGRLRHLYLPEYFTFVDVGKLRLTLDQLRQLETFVNFSVDNFQMEDLRKMISLRNFLINGRHCIWSKDDLRHLMESPFITVCHLKSPLQLIIRAEVINEDPAILASLSLKSICINELEIRGSINEVVFSELGENASNGFKVFSSSLTKLKLNDCEIGEKGIMELEKLPCLEELELRGKAIRDSKMSFSQGSFKQLRKLILSHMENIKEWEVGEGALPNLISLDLYRCALERIPEGLPTSIKIESYGSDINGSEKYHKG